MGRFQPGDAVRVREAYPPGHVRTPFFTRGKTGVIENIVGDYANPEQLAYGRRDTPKLTLYHVRFQQTELWPDYDGPTGDTAMVAIYEPWLDAEQQKDA